MYFSLERNICRWRYNCIHGEYNRKNSETCNKKPLDLRGLLEYLRCEHYENILKEKECYNSNEDVYRPSLEEFYLFFTTSPYCPGDSKKYYYEYWEDECNLSKPSSNTLNTFLKAWKSRLNSTFILSCCWSSTTFSSCINSIFRNSFISSTDTHCSWYFFCYHNNCISSINELYLGEK